MAALDSGPAKADPTRGLCCSVALVAHTPPGRLQLSNQLSLFFRRLSEPSASIPNKPMSASGLEFERSPATRQLQLPVSLEVWLSFVPLVPAEFWSPAEPTMPPVLCAPVPPVPIMPPVWLLPPTPAKLPPTAAKPPVALS